MENCKLFVEGVADKRFLSEYLKHLGFIFDSKQLIECGGWHRLKEETNLQELRKSSDNGGVNLVLFDADDNFLERKRALESLKSEHQIAFELFLFPNNQESGDLEELLERIITPANQGILDCWHQYEQNLSQLSIEGRTPPPLTTPAKKTKIYGYLEALLPPKEKELIKEKKREYRNPLHWDLNTNALEALKHFLIQLLQEKEPNANL